MVAATFKLRKERLLRPSAGSEPCDYQLQKEKLLLTLLYIIEGEKNENRDSKFEHFRNVYFGFNEKAWEDRRHRKNSGE